MSDDSLADGFDLEAEVLALAADLKALRAGQISVPDALARANLAKQMMAALRLFVKAREYIAQQANDITPLPSPDSEHAMGGPKKHGRGAK